MSAANNVQIIKDGPYAPDCKTGTFSLALRELITSQSQAIRESGSEGLVLLSFNTVDMTKLIETAQAIVKLKSEDKASQAMISDCPLAFVLLGSIRPPDDPRRGKDPLVGRILRVQPNEYEIRIDSPTHLPFYLEGKFVFDIERKMYAFTTVGGRADIDPLPDGSRSKTRALYPMLTKATISVTLSEDNQRLIIRDTKNSWFMIDFWIPHWMRLRRSARLMPHQSK